MITSDTMPLSRGECGLEVKFTTLCLTVTGQGGIYAMKRTVCTTCTQCNSVVHNWVTVQLTY